MTTLDLPVMTVESEIDPDMCLSSPEAVKMIADSYGTFNVEDFNRDDCNLLQQNIDHFTTLGPTSVDKKTKDAWKKTLHTMQEQWKKMDAEVKRVQRNKLKAAQQAYYELLDDIVLVNRIKGIIRNRNAEIEAGTPVNVEAEALKAASGKVERGENPFGEDWKITDARVAKSTYLRCLRHPKALADRLEFEALETQVEKLYNRIVLKRRAIEADTKRINDDIKKSDKTKKLEIDALHTTDADLAQEQAKLITKKRIFDIQSNHLIDSIIYTPEEEAKWLENVKEFNRIEKEKALKEIATANKKQQKKTKAKNKKEEEKTKILAEQKSHAIIPLH